MMKPLILLSGGTGAAANGTPTWTVNQNYAENIRRAGGIPLLAVNNACADEYAELADGLLLSGGKDVVTSLYGQEQKYDFVITDPQRDDLEYRLIRAFVEQKKPIFGVCRGIQILNTYFGGTLYQDIPTELGGDHAKGVCHPVHLKADSILGRLYGETLETNSYHHQALDALGKGLIATGWSDANGHSIVEAIEHESLPIWSVQWHPERMTGPDTNPKNCSDSLPIFAYFIEQCQK
ncbi:MAG: gamma-glutamyl-gamma-aminobutyrate hydrolase family protein [Lachnospiraceae bacterium]|nr:gamma-glutamyl-gamma-aminobutyrate hydrolase family protein [Lachnospiraceae bacterium]